MENLHDEKMTRRISISLHEDDIQVLDSLRAFMGENSNMQNSSLLRTVLLAALENRDKMDSYIKERKMECDVFDPEIDDYNSLKFARTLVKIPDKKLKAGVIMDMGNCRVLVERGVHAEHSKAGAKYFLHFKEEKGKSKTKSEAEVWIDLTTVSGVVLHNLESDTEMPFVFFPAENLAEHEFLQVKCDKG